MSGFLTLIKVTNHITFPYKCKYLIKLPEKGYVCVMEFRDRLKQVMIYQDIKTQELADKSGVNKRTIDHYLMSDSQEPSVSKAVKIAQALNVSVEYLVTGRSTGSTDSLSLEMREFIRDFSALPPRQKSAVTQIVHFLAEPFVRERGQEKKAEGAGQELSY